MTGTPPTGYDPGQLTASLKEYAREGTEAAALGLLVEHDYWLRRIAYHHPQYVMTDDGVPFRLDWIELCKDFGRNKLQPCSSTQFSILSIALSIQVFDVRINLGDLVAGLDRTNTTAVLRAIATAAGHPDAIG